MMFFQTLVEIFTEFSNFTSLHGMKILAEHLNHLSYGSQNQRNRTWRFVSIGIWSSTLIVGIISSILMMKSTWNRFEKTPTITAVDSYDYPIWHVPFPAITMCSINKVYKPATKQIRKKLMEKNISETAIDHFLNEVASLIRPKKLEFEQDILNIWDILKIMGYSTEKLLYELMEPCSKMITHCYWINQRTNCKKLFQLIKSSEGFCCSFNYRTNKNYRHLYMNSNFTIDNYIASGVGIGLELLLHSEQWSYQSYTDPFFGAIFVAHYSDDFVDKITDYKYVFPGYVATFTITPTVIESDESVRSMSVKQRNCYFKNENYLEFNTKYSAENCMAECRMKIILRLCKCIPFYYPHIEMPKYKNYRQCDFTDVECLDKYREQIISLQRRNSDKSSITNLCDCEPSCSKIKYDTLMYYSNQKKAPNERSTESDVSHDEYFNLTHLYVAFSDVICLKYKRSVYLTWDRLFASFGGIFGIFLGGSIISLIEIIYFCLERVYIRFF